MHDELAIRMKRYESATTAVTLIRRLPVIIRVDGRAFHTWTRGLGKPFDSRLSCTMVYAAQSLREEMQGCKLAYVQSDEASFLLLDTDRLETQPWLGYDLQKVVSLSAAGMTAHFNSIAYTQGMGTVLRRPATFDSRAFNLPPAEVANYFLWRVRDAHRNAILAVAQSKLPPRAIHGKKCAELLTISEVRDAYLQLTRYDKLGVWIMPGNPASGSGEPSRHDTAEPRYVDVAALVEEAICSAERRIVEPSGN